MKRRLTRSAHYSTHSTCIVTVLLFLSSTFGCSDSMNPNSSKICEPETPRSERESCQMEGLVVRESNDLTGICSSNCTSLDGLSVYGVDGLKDLSFLRGFQQIGSLGLTSNSDLETVSGAEGIDIGGLSILKNQSLASLEAFTGITELTIFGVSETQSLENFKGLDNVTSIGFGGGVPRETIIDKNQGLVSLDGLDNVESLGSTYIQENENLERIDAFSALNRLEGSLTITQNPSLESIESLMDIAIIEGNVSINRNPSLPSCEVQNFVDTVEIVGEVDAYENGTGTCE